MEKTTKLQKSIKLYLSKKLKKTPSLKLNRSINPSRMMSACKYPQTPSFDKRNLDINCTTIDDAATLADCFLSDDDSSSTHTFTKLHAMDHADFSSNSASTPSMTSSSATEEISTKSPGVGIVTFSMDPYEDFRRSMKRMVEAHHVDASQHLDWDFLEELLFCYLELNDKSIHKHVLRAFSDITAWFCRSKGSVMSRRTISVHARRQKAEEDEMLNTPHAHFCADFPEDCDNEQSHASSY
ncbi:Transcription repressor OFP14 [Rhynchospora pubera]|uniref:Transcription repressor n=1 Tax=Rhynchospora pubera TaxID=906938 RepID=A0AAV8HU14_9POAL|nr:Transcription repressor OFP14 [Rhynchospora pubera]